jgi:ADP-ribose pyrophosphatase
MVKEKINLSSLKKWIRLSSKNVYSSDYFAVKVDTVKLPNGSTMDYDWFWAPDFCVIVPTYNNKLVVIENYRYPADQWFLEFPAGHVQRGEDVMEAAKRELMEETGYSTRKIKYLQWYYTSSRTLQKGHVFFAETGDKSSTRREPSELQRVRLVTDAYIEDKIRMGQVKHAATLVAYASVKALALM